MATNNCRERVILQQSKMMILYNVTVNINPEVHDEWVAWMKEVHIPEVMQTGMFLENRFCRIHGFEEGGFSYSIQYLAPDMPTYDRYQAEFAPSLQAAHQSKYQGKFAAFRTILEVIHIETPPAKA